MKNLGAFIIFILLSATTYAEGFKPSEEQKANAENVFRDFLNSITEEKYEKAYELQTDSMKKSMTLKQWSDFESDFRRRSGGKAQFGNIRATWYKDPPNSESPGIYVAFDFACRYENINICSGVLMLHSRQGEKFSVMRYEKKTVDKETEMKHRTNEAANK